MLLRLSLCLSVAALSVPLLSTLPAVAKPPQSKIASRPAAEVAITNRLRGLRKLDNIKRAKETRDLALAIRKLPPGQGRLSQATSLAYLSTEGDFGRDTLFEVAKTLGNAIESERAHAKRNELTDPINTLAQLVRYENVPVSLNAPAFRNALAALDAADRKRDAGNFRLTDLDGKKWTLKDLKGRVVLVNFWATWCPPCRKELPDLQKFYKHYGKKNLVVLGITDEKATKVRPFVRKIKLSYPILIDNKAVVKQRFGVQGIPHTFIYDRNGKLAAQAIDMRTEKQFQGLLAKAGLK